MSKDTAAIRDQLGNDPDTFPVLVAEYQETFAIEEQATTLTRKTIGNAFIIGNSVNGIIGVANGSGGGQITLGNGDFGINIIHAIVNPKRVFHEHFRDTEFQTTPLTANWDTTNFRLAMSTDTDHNNMKNTVATFSTIALNDGTITRVTVSSTETKFSPGDVIKYFMKANTADDWVEVTKGAEHVFATPGTNLNLMVVFLGVGGADTFIEDVDVFYDIT